MKINTKQMILVSLFAALTAVGAFIKIPLGAVPVTLQLLITALAGITLGAKLGALSQLVYVIIGLIGIPVFASGKVGFAAIISPSFGYLIGFIIGAYVIGKIAEGSVNPAFTRLFAAVLGGTVVVYMIGVPYLYLIMTNVIGKNIAFATAVKTGFIVFAPGDLIKCVLAALVGSKVVPAIKKITA